MTNPIFHMDIKTRRLLSCGAIGSPLFVLVFLIEGALRYGYSPLRHPISSLSIGDEGWIQVVNFLLAGLLLLVFAVGLQRIFRSNKKATHGPLLIGLVGIGLIGAGIFTTDPVYGYPQDKPLILAQYSIHGHLHDFFSLLVFICLPIACFAFRRLFATTGQRGWALYSVFTGIAMFAAFVLAGMGFKQYRGLVNFAGVLQRLSILLSCIWITLLALHLLKTSERMLSDVPNNPQ
jgi:hypothetical membrane protein